jgi:hypothetical protein
MDGRMLTFINTASTHYSELEDTDVDRASGCG